jgi:hypothetical protein
MATRYWRGLRALAILWAVAGAGTAWADQTATVTVTPPSVVEDNSAVLERLRQNPIDHAYSYETLREDSSAPPRMDLVEIDNSAQGGGVRTLGAAWESISSGNLWPPDPTLAVGPTNVLTCTNAGFRIYSKTGVQQFSSSFGSFFSGVAAFTGTSDPKVAYDPGSGRWFLMILGLNNSSHSWYLIAVSDDSDPNGTWRKYGLDSTLNGTSATTTWSDYPGLGFDGSAIYITANMFSQTTGGFQYVKLRVIPKQQLLDFAPTLTYSDIWSITNTDGANAFTLQPASHYGANTEPFLISQGSSGRIHVYGVDNPLGSPTLVKRGLTVTGYSAAPAVVQMGGSPTLSTVDQRLLTATWRNDALYACHSISTNSIASSRWYQVNTASWPTVSLTQQGTVSIPGTSQWMPSIAVNGAGQVVMGFSRASTTEFPSIYYVSRNAGDPAGTMSAPTLIHAGTHYLGEGGNGPVRWGDYTGMVVDPAADGVFWHFNEFGVGTSVWHTWTQQIILSPSHTLSVASSGATGVAITVSPTDLGGSGNGVTPFSRSYAVDTPVTLTAPASSGSTSLTGWQLGGVDQGPGTTLHVTLSADISATAVYAPPRTIIVNSSPGSGATFTASPQDALGSGGGTTTWLLEYPQGTAVTLGAPAAFNGGAFLRWTIGGVDQPTGQASVTFTVSGDTMIFERFRAACLANFNGDGGLDVQDFLAFLAAYAGADPACDVNNDGVVDVQDFLAFLSLYAAGCP